MVVICAHLRKICAYLRSLIPCFENSDFLKALVHSDTVASPRLRRSPQRRLLAPGVAGKGDKDPGHHPYHGSQCGRHRQAEARRGAQRRHGRRCKAHLAGGGGARRLQFRRPVLQGVARLERQVSVERRRVAAAEFGRALRRAVTGCFGRVWRLRRCSGLADGSLTAAGRPGADLQASPQPRCCLAPLAARPHLR